MAKLENILRKMFYITFAIFPVGIGFLLGAEVLYSSTKDINYGASTYYRHAGFFNRYTCVFAFLIIILIGILFYILGLNKKILNEKTKKFLPYIVLIMAVFGRLMLFYICKDIIKPFSDGKNVWQIATGLREGVFFRKMRQNGWNNFTTFVYFWAGIFELSYGSLIVLQFIVDSLIAAEIFFIAYKLIKSVDIAFLSGALYAVNPSLILRGFFLSPDIFSLFFLVTAVFLLTYILENTKYNKCFYLISLVSGILIGLANSIKSVALLFSIAFIIVIIMMVLKNKWKKKEIISWLVVVLLIIVPSFTVNKAVLAVSSQVFDYPVVDGNTWHFITVGLNPYGEGQIGHHLAWYYQDLIESGDYTYDEARDMAIEFLKNGWEETQRPVLPWLWEKVKWAWRDDVYTYNLSALGSMDEDNASTSAQHRLIRFWANYENSIQQCFYIFIMSTCFVGLLFVILKHINSEGLFIISLYSFGFALMMLISECQSRYKTNIMPFICILSAIGIYEMAMVLKNIFSKSVTTKQTTQEKEPITS